MLRTVVAGLLLSTLLASAATLGGCSTVSGAGQDVAAGGRAVSQGAQDVKRRL